MKENRITGNSESVKQKEWNGQRERENKRCPNSRCSCSDKALLHFSFSFFFFLLLLPPTVFPKS